MAIRILRLNDDPILKKVCKRVNAIDANILTMLEDMMDTLHATPTGAALAANQVGIMYRLVVVDFFGLTLKMINPEIISQEGSQDCKEACLSFPTSLVNTRRPLRVTVQYLDVTGNVKTVIGEREIAKCYCHEIDHLNGITLLDRQIDTL